MDLPNGVENHGNGIFSISATGESLSQLKSAVTKDDSRLVITALVVIEGEMIVNFEPLKEPLLFSGDDDHDPE